MDPCGRFGGVSSPLSFPKQDAKSKLREIIEKRAVDAKEAAEGGTSWRLRVRFDGRLKKRGVNGCFYMFL